ncbi:uncharacterized protein LOC108846801 [Raphanus sativus]|uniref:Uncharacterized protein LOC108846798 n=1 Tax=Raphanus sativus TaxID=3726 RepID=A0A9W3CN14_RAPSA|nr:uncharacterized protein LOC108846798 [Raphanus sativus]XP_056862083.1 uncharacterized protein LOC108846801 [Raphanus sativus]
MFSIGEPMSEVDDPGNRRFWSLMVACSVDSSQPFSFWRFHISGASQEVSLLIRLEHKNLVKLLGFCNEGDEVILVSEFVPDRFIFESEKTPVIETVILQSYTIQWDSLFAVIIFSCI